MPYQRYVKKRKTWAENKMNEIERLRELQLAVDLYLECCKPGLSPYIKENGRHGSSPWAELIEAAKVARQETKQ